MVWCSDGSIISQMGAPTNYYRLRSGESTFSQACVVLFGTTDVVGTHPIGMHPCPTKFFQKLHTSRC